MSKRAGATIVGMSLLEPWWTAATEADDTAGGAPSAACPRRCNCCGADKHCSRVVL